MMLPAPTADQLDQLPSGVAVLPLLVSISRLVPAGRLAVTFAAPQMATRPASSTEETNVPPDVYEATRTLSTSMAGVALVAASPIRRLVTVGIVLEMVSFSAPST